MIERIVIIDKVDPVQFYGVNNANMHLLKNLFPKLRISARGSVVRVVGEESETAEFEAGLIWRRNGLTIPDYRKVNWKNTEKIVVNHGRS